MTNTLGIPLYNLKMLSEIMYKCMTLEASEGNMIGEGNMDTNKCKCAGGYAFSMEAT